MAALCVGYPFDTVKVRFQNPEIAHRYRSTFNAITTIVREERVLGLYKGITSPLASCAFMNGLVFSSYRFFMKVQLADANAVPSLTQITLAGIGSGIVSSIITTPTELIKIHQQNTLGKTPSARQVALDIFRKHGVRGLYRGITATAIRDCGYGAYFFGYEATCRYFSRTPPTAIPSTGHPEAPILTWPVLLLAGAVAGIAGWVATFPFDVVKTRVQSTFGEPIAAPSAAAETRLTPNPYRNILSTIIHSYRTEGLSVFFRGLAPTLIRAIPVNMVTFATFEGVVHLLS
ncbi:mitochondrial carrier [Gloeophyllum trabeum ATCC 11539]|uniref:Mitochondrial carrier n=1 Tax=Gloeophyllum trabeum (strain ATCC 11539 / FP-39264 / Madison 617) TaxID=670483 RepID=S7RNU2_GLOTA|nr:mitochondrial carrier [Gloeophyllum trabeum ATCC 11539]EPQ56195.1 mitochondrial carrier [Gloeophyllum trabeum ATCC 11539]